MRTELRILQSLIRLKTLVEGVDGEDLLWIDFLGAIWDKFMFFEEKFEKCGSNRKALLEDLEIFRN